MTYLESVDNALRLLVSLAAHQRISVSDAAKELGVAPSTAHRLLSTMRYRGFVRQTDDRCYIPGPAFATLMKRNPATAKLAERALPYLGMVMGALDETCHLVVRVNRDVQFVASVEAQQALKISSRQGQTMPAHLVSGGKMLLALLPRPELDTLYPAEEPDLLAGKDRNIFAAELASARCRGYTVNVGDTERGIAAVAVPVPGADGKPIAAMSVSVPSVRYSSTRVPKFAAALRRGADALSAELSG